MKSIAGSWRGVSRAVPEDADLLRRLSIFEEGDRKRVRMAHLAVVGSHSVNGVAALHTRLLKDSLMSDFHGLWPRKFNNKTNGITQRRWLKQANPALSRLITEAIGEGWGGPILTPWGSWPPMRKMNPFGRPGSPLKR